MIAHDKGKPVARQGRKAVSLEVVETVRLPKAIEHDTRLLTRIGKTFGALYYAVMPLIISGPSSIIFIHSEIFCTDTEQNSLAIAPKN